MGNILVKEYIKYTFLNLIFVLLKKRPLLMDHVIGVQKISSYDMTIYDLHLINK